MSSGRQFARSMTFHMVDNISADPEFVSYVNISSPFFDSFFELTLSQLQIIIIIVIIIINLQPISSVIVQGSAWNSSMDSTNALYRLYSLVFVGDLNVFGQLPGWPPHQLQEGSTYPHQLWNLFLCYFPSHVSQILGLLQRNTTDWCPVML